MFKVMIVLGRRPDMPVEAFRRYWVETHGPIAAAMPGLVRYTQHHAVPGPAGAPPGPDGIAELWYADEEAWRASRTSPEAAAARDDLVNFCDLGRVAYLFVEAIELL